MSVKQRRMKDLVHGVVGTWPGVAGTGKIREQDGKMRIAGCTGQ